MKVLFTAFKGSVDKRDIAYSVREQVNGKFSIYKGCKPLKKDLESFPSAISIMMELMGVWTNITTKK